MSTAAGAFTTDHVGPYSETRLTRAVDDVLDELAALQGRYMSETALLVARLKHAAPGFEQAVIHQNSMTREFLDAQRALLRRRVQTADAVEALGSAVVCDADDDLRRVTSTRALRQLLDGWWVSEVEHGDDVIRRAEVALAMETHFLSDSDAGRPATRTSIAVPPSTNALSPTITQMLDDAGDGDLVLALSLLADDLHAMSTPVSGDADSVADRDHGEEADGPQVEGAAVLVLDGVGQTAPLESPDDVDYSQDAFDRFWSTLPPRPRRPKRRLARGCLLVMAFGSGAAAVASGVGWS